MPEVATEVVMVLDGELASLRLEPGDTLVLMSDDTLMPSKRSFLRQKIGELFPGWPLLILDDGKRLGVVRQKAPDLPA